jgi:WD40 repeat protein
MKLLALISVLFLFFAFEQGIAQVTIIDPDIIWVDSAYKSSSNVDFSKDSKYVAIGGEYARIFNVENGQLIKTLPSTNSGGFVIYSKDGKKLYTLKVNSINIWDMEKWEIIKTINVNGGVFNISPDEKFAALISNNNQDLIIWDLEADTLVKKYNGFCDFIFFIHFSPDGNLISLGCFNDNTIKVINWRENKEIFSYNRQPTSNSFDAIFSPDGKKLLFSSGMKTIKLWNIESNSLEKEFTTDKEYVPVGLCFSPDGLNFAYTGYNAFKIYEISTGKIIYSYKGVPTGYFIKCSPNGKYISYGEYVRIYKAQWDPNSVIENPVNNKELKILNYFPNPMNDILNIKIFSQYSNDIKLNFSDLSGKIIIEKSYYLLSGENSLQLDIKNIIAGTYYLTVSSGNLSDSRKMIINK